MKTYKQSANGLIKLIFLATIMLTFLSGCEQSEVDILKEKNNQLDLSLRTLKDKNNELESNIKILSHDLQFANKQNGKKKSDLMSEYAIQFKDEITQSIREEYEWVAIKNSSYIFLVILIPLLFLYHGNLRKNKQLKEDSVDLINQLEIYKDDLERKYNEKVLENKKEIDGYKQKIDEELNKESQETRKNRLKKEEKIKLSDRIVEIQNVLIQSRTNASVNK